MPRPATSGNATIWVILSVAVTVMFGVFGFIWSIIQAQITDMKTEFVKYQSDSRWQYATKDFVTGKLEGIKDEEATYRRGLEKTSCK